MNWLMAVLGLIGWGIFIKNFGISIGNERGGGSEPEMIQTPTTPAPSASQSAADIYQAKLQYDPLVAQQEFDIQKSLVPQQTALYQSLYNQYYPQMAQQQQALQQQLYPYQSQIVEQGAQSALSRLQNPNYMTSQEQTAQDYTRGKSVTDLQKAMRERSNLGGGLYGGRSAASEAQSVSDLLNQYQVQDYQQRMQAGQAAQQALNPYMQILYPSVGTQQPQINPYQYQSAVQSPDQLAQAMFQASQPNYMYQQGSPSPAWGLAGSILGGAASGFGAGAGASLFK